MFDALRERVRRARREETLPESASSLLDDDPVFDLLAQELGELGGVQLLAAPRERTLALLRTEVRAQKARGAFSGGSRRVFPRVALGGAALALLVAASLGMFALTDESGDQDQIAGSSTTSESLAVGTTTDTQSPDTTGSSVPDTVTTEAPATTVTTVPATTPTTVHTATTGHQPVPTSPPSSARPRTTTTDEPDTTTTTGEAVMTWKDREDSARTVVLSVADKIMTGSLAGVDTYVASSAQSDLAHMIAAVDRPSSARVVSVRETSAGARVLLEMTTSVSDGQDAVVDVEHRFYFDTRADENGALITAIYFAPVQ
jgi:hypothetical protein